jgi:MFS family permease
VGFSAHAVFVSGLVAGIIGGAAGLLAAGCLNERVERRTVILAGAVLASAGLALVFTTGMVWHNLVALLIAASLVNAGGYLWLFNMYTYTAVAYPTGIRSVGTGWTDGFGHVGSMISPLIIGALFTATAGAGYIGFFGYVIIPGALLPALLLVRFGMDQRGASLEAVTGVA